jgi:hypothetical protein
MNRQDAKGIKNEKIGAIKYSTSKLGALGVMAVQTSLPNAQR